MRRFLKLISLTVLLMDGGQPLQLLPQNPARVIEIHAHRYAFVPSEITVRRGERTQVKLISDDVPHSLLIEAMGINQEATKTHQTQFAFTPLQTGNFQGRCGRFCGSGHGKMTFTVHVIGI